LLIECRPSTENVEPIFYLKGVHYCVDYVVNDVRDGDLMGLRIRHTENVQDKVVGISFRRSCQLKPDEVWGVLGMVVQSHASFGLSDRIELDLDHVRMPAGNDLEKTKGRSLN